MSQTQGKILIIRGGANVHPSEVEAVLAEPEGVRDGVVVGVTNLPEGQEIAAVVVWRVRSESCPRICERKSSATLPVSSTFPKALAISISLSFSSRKIRPSIVSDKTRL